MNKLLHINAHYPYSFAPGNLSAAMTDLAVSHLSEIGFEVQQTKVADGNYDIDEEITKHQWADVVLIQTPVYWMSVPWRFKQYMDDVYTPGTDGRLCSHDGRTSAAPKKNYGSGGSLDGTKYLLSLTFNAPEQAFNDPEEYLFQGKNVDDLFFPVHMTYRFFKMTPLETFVCYDVLKNPQIQRDFEQFKQHLNTQLSGIQ